MINDYLFFYLINSYKSFIIYLNILNSYNLSKYKVRQTKKMSDLYMYTQNRFITGNPLQNRTQYAFEMASSALHRQFHEMRT